MINQGVIPVLADFSNKNGGPRHLLERYGVRGYPTVLFLDAQGKKIGTLRKRNNVPGVKAQIEAISGVRSAGGGPAPGPVPPWWFAVAGVLALFITAGAQWTTVRIMDGYNEHNTAGRAVGWMLLTGAVFGVGLMIPLALAQVLALGVWAVAMLAINFRAYDLGVLKSIVAIPTMLLISFGLQFVLGLALGAGLEAAELGTPEDVRNVQEQIRDYIVRAPLEAADAPAFADPDAAEPEPRERDPERTKDKSDLSEGVKPVEGMPGHYSYRDKNGKAYIVDSFEKVPVEYRY